MIDLSDEMKRRWAVAAAIFAWMAAILGPALTFDINLQMEGEAGVRLAAFFQIAATCVFAVVVRKRSTAAIRVTWALLAFSAIIFVSYSLLRDVWTCRYFDEGRVVIGTTLVDRAQVFLVNRGMTGSRCLEVLSAFGGDSMLIWDRHELILRFLSLFALYCLSWLLLAFAIITATSRAPPISTGAST